MSVNSEGYYVVVDSDGEEVWVLNPTDPSSTLAGTGYGRLGNLPSSLNSARGIVVESSGDYLVMSRSTRDIWRINPANPIRYNDR